MNVTRSCTSSTATPTGVRRLRFDVGARPFLVLFELTRACELACSHCRADAHLGADPGELSSDEVRGVLDDLASLGAPRPIVVLTGGAPLQRDDLDGLVAHGAQLGLTIAVSPAGTPRASAERLAALRRAGATTVSLSLDGASTERHDAFRGVHGSFAWTIDARRAARAVGLHLQVSTTVSRETVLELPALSHLVAELGAQLWNCFFPVPVGRGRSLTPLSAEETEDVLRFLATAGHHVPLKTTESPRWETNTTPWPSPTASGGRRRNVRERPLTSIDATAPLLSALRDPSRLAGRCGRCAQRDTCGGSRAQAFARTGDVFAEDPGERSRTCRRCRCPSGRSRRRGAPPRPSWPSPAVMRREHLREGKGELGGDDRKGGEHQHAPAP